MNTPPAPRSRLWTWTKRLFKLGTLLVLAAVPTVYFGAPVLARQEKVRHRLESALTRSFGTPVEISSMAWTWKEGLTLREFRSVAFKADTITIQPRLVRMLEGKGGARVVFQNPEAAVLDTGAAAEFRLPKACRKGIRFDDVEVRNGTYTVMGADGSRRARITGISMDGTGRFANRAADLKIAEFSGSFNGMAVTGSGTLRLAEDGLSGELHVQEAAAVQNSQLQEALRLVRITLSPAAAEPRWY